MTDRVAFKKELVEYIQKQVDSENGHNVPSSRHLPLSEELIFHSIPSFQLTPTGNKLMSIYFVGNTAGITDRGLSRAIVDIDRHATGPFYIIRGRKSTMNKVTVYGSEEVMLTKLSDDISFWLEQSA